MYSNKFAAKLVNIRQLCKKDMGKLSIFMVLSTYYPTFRFVRYVTAPCFGLVKFVVFITPSLK